MVVNINLRMKSGLCVIRYSILILLLILPVLVLAGNDRWQKVEDVDLRIVPGSALDFSNVFVNTNPNRLLKMDNGKLIVDDGEPVRFLCAPLVFNRPQGNFPSHQKSDELAKQLKFHGYNMARFHHVENALMDRVKGDFNYNPEQVDRFHYLLFALKRQGIRWSMDALTSWNGAYDVGNNRFDRKQHNIKKDIHYSDVSKAHWKKIVKTILVQKNPYTKHVIIDDPALSIITLVNEMGVQYNTKKHYPKEIKALFKDWLIKNGHKNVKPPNRYEVSKNAALMNEFITDLENDTQTWMTEYLREQGYKGLITAYNNGKTAQATAARSLSDVVSYHAYHDLPSKYIRKNSRQRGVSSIEDSLGYIGFFALNRYLDKPFMVDEYDQPYWNSWRREAGLAMGAVAALQDWDVVCRYANPVALAYDGFGPRRSQAMYPFEIGLDPIARASETLAALLFLRKDVDSARHVVGVDVNGAFNSDDASIARVEKPLGWISLVTKIGLQKSNKNFGVSMTLPYATQRNNKMAKLVALLKNSDEVKWGGYYDKLVENGVLTKGNITDKAGSVFQSDTGQIVVDINKRMMKINTERTEAVVWDGKSSIFIKHVKASASDTPILLSVSSLDSRPIHKSKRLLMILASDAINTGAEFSEERAEIIELGKLPVLMKSIQVSVSINTSLVAKPVVYALSLNGRRKEILQSRINKGVIDIAIDTATLKFGPTTFFEILTGT